MIDKKKNAIIESTHTIKEKKKFQKRVKKLKTTMSNRIKHLVEEDNKNS